jgi:hypothetical protein
MRAVETVIRLFDPAYDVRRISARRRLSGNPWFKRGEVFLRALEVLRDAEGPRTVREIARAMLVKHGTAEPTAKQTLAMYGTAQRSPQNHAGKSVVRVGEGMPARWVIAVR